MVDRQGSQFTAYSIDLQLRSEGLCSGEELLEGVIDHDGLEEVWEEDGAGDLGVASKCVNCVREVGMCRGGGQGYVRRRGGNLYV